MDGTGGPDAALPCGPLGGQRESPPYPIRFTMNGGRKMGCPGATLDASPDKNTVSTLNRRVKVRVLIVDKS